MANFDINLQLSLTYQDTIDRIADAKKNLFEITKWIITLNSGVLGLFFSVNKDFSIYFTLLPILIGIIGLLLEYSISYELNVHRKTLANLRKKVGGLIYDINKEQVDLMLKNKKTSHKFYYFFYKFSNFSIIIFSSIITALIIFFNI
ncbi:hypothetical protein NAMH_1137 [Nautilia profundicola AmH]|uniref:Uncharacterized protein n=1 Tax=Nautilia profundicola (strain ATCC BAA-1463 / DSM 18972 / AmH) TaxID=598659 RepID=B9LA75_NAUPA|nr:MULTISPECIES: hypothetical protein [Nautilia]ACM92624.1 hypothetical protein NAMH_1137 [Nautilia profundicola AmH]AZV46809.1 hypothetical protein C3L23_05830 [Nautilia sp. PV-1]